jgi:hypothetical protein
MAITSPLCLGIDFDNTIVSYDELFWRVAVEQQLVPESLPVAKTEVRNHIRSIGREPEWTAMQGMVYGDRIVEAKAFPGVIDFFRACNAAQIPLYIVSHKTKFPIAQGGCDLHAAARGWLKEQGILDLIPADHVYFELTREAKLARLVESGCTHFIDDLPEFLCMPGFPKSVTRIFFNPQNDPVKMEDVCSKASWHEIQAMFFHE